MPSKICAGSGCPGRAAGGRPGSAWCSSTGNVRIGVPARRRRAIARAGAVVARSTCAPVLRSAHAAATAGRESGADPAGHRRRAGEGGPVALETPCALLEGDVPPAHYGERRPSTAATRGRRRRGAQSPQARNSGGRRAHALRGAEPVRRCDVEPLSASAASTCAGIWHWTPCCPRCRYVRRHWPPGGSKTSG